MTTTNRPYDTPLKKYENHEDYKIVERKGHHNVGTGAARWPGAACGCSPDTEGGYAYRDVVVERIDNDKNNKWDRIRFYHQSAVVKKNADTIRVNAHGYGTSSTTRERINSELPRGYRLVQRDFDVYLRVPTGDLLDVPTHSAFYLDYSGVDGRVELRSSSGKIADLLPHESLKA